MIEQMFADVAAGTVRSADSLCNKHTTKEALFKTYTFHDPSCNVFRFRNLNERWLSAATIHFFAETEEAEDLLRINPFARKYLTGTKFTGAYGPIFLPQLRLCIAELRRDSWTRRAVAASGIVAEQDINRPACINSFHFLREGDALSVHCYQRSCQLYGVLPYDAVLVTNVLNYVAESVGMPIGRLYWSFGSLHCTDEDLSHPRNNVVGSLLFDVGLLSSPNLCRQYLGEL